MEQAQCAHVSLAGSTTKKNVPCDKPVIPEEFGGFCCKSHATKAVEFLGKSEKIRIDATVFAIATSAEAEQYNKTRHDSYKARAGITFEGIEATVRTSPIQTRLALDFVDMSAPRTQTVVKDVIETAKGLAGVIGVRLMAVKYEVVLDTVYSGFNADDLVASLKSKKIAVVVGDEAVIGGEVLAEKMAEIAMAVKAE